MNKKTSILVAILAIILIAAGLWYFVFNDTNKTFTAEQAKPKIQYLPQSPKEKALGIKPVKIEGLSGQLYDFTEYDANPQNQGKSPADAMGL